MHACAVPPSQFHKPVNHLVLILAAGDLLLRCVVRTMMGCLFCSSFDLKTSGKGALILGLISICVQVDLIFDTLFESEGAIRSSLGHRLASERFRCRPVRVRLHQVSKRSAGVRSPVFPTSSNVVDVPLHCLSLVFDHGPDYGLTQAQQRRSYLSHIPVEASTIRV